MGWPRAPASREVYERLGMRERAKVIAEFIGRVLTEERPERVVFVGGVKGSPDLRRLPHELERPRGLSILGNGGEFRYLNKERRFGRSKGGIVEEQDFRLVRMPGGILFEVLMARFPPKGGTYLEFDKEDIEGGSLERLRVALEGAP